MATEVRIKIRGVRAIHSAPSSQNLTTGGNTSSIEFIDDNHHIFINAGFGINEAGDEWMEKRKKQKNAFHGTILFSDFMWDSTMGLPFFSPMHLKSSQIEILTGASVIEAKEAMNDVSSNLFTPFNGADSFAAKVSIKKVTSSSQIGRWTINALSLDHPLTPYPITIWRLVHKLGMDIGVIMLCNNDKFSIDKVQKFLAGCKTLLCAASNSTCRDQWSNHRTTFSDALSIALSTGAQELYLNQFHPEMNDLNLQRELAKLQSTLLLTQTKQAHRLKIHLGSEIEEILPIYANLNTKAG
jgi:hypothetical protein